MSNQKYSQLLYPHSPFLEKDENLVTSTNNISVLIKKSKIFPLHAIFHEICNIAEKLSLIQVHEYNWIKEKFNCSSDDVDWFFLGYTTPASIIIAACLLETVPALRVINILNQKTIDTRILSINKYKTKMLSKTFALSANHLRTKPQKIINSIYSLIESSPYNQNQFYLAGIESSKITANNLAQCVESLLTPLN